MLFRTYKELEQNKTGNPVEKKYIFNTNTFGNIKESKKI